MKIVIFGGGGFAIEVASYMAEQRINHPSLQIEGIIDEGEPRIAEAEAVLSHSLTHWADPSGVPWQSDHRVVVAVGEPLVRHTAFERLKSDGLEFYTLVHPTAHVAATASLGDGAIVCPFGFVGPFARVGDNAVLNTFASAGHHSTIEASAVLSPYAALNGAARLGRASFMGSRATIAPGVSVGENSKVSAGSVVSRDAQSNSMIAGNPAKSRIMFRSLAG